MELVADEWKGNYAKLVGGGTLITSTAFTIPSQATALTVDVLVGPSQYGTPAKATIYLLYGPDYSGMERVLYGDNTATSWKRFTFNVSSWAGQSVKIMLKCENGPWVAFDNVGANLAEEACGDPCYPTASVGWPVNTSSGGESLAATYLLLPGRGLPIAFSRS